MRKDATAEHGSVQASVAAVLFPFRFTVLRHHPDGYLTVLTAEPGARVRAEPFDALELETDELIGDV